MHTVRQADGQIDGHPHRDTCIEIVVEIEIGAKVCECIRQRTHTHTFAMDVCNVRGSSGPAQAHGTL